MVFTTLHVQCFLKKVFLQQQGEKTMINHQSCERPLAFHLAKKMPYLQKKEGQANQFVQGNQSIEFTGSPETSVDVIYDF